MVRIRRGPASNQYAALWRVMESREERFFPSISNMRAVVFPAHAHHEYDGRNDLTKLVNNITPSSEWGGLELCTIKCKSTPPICSLQSCCDYIFPHSGKDRCISQREVIYGTTIPLVAVHRSTSVDAHCPQTQHANQTSSSVRMWQMLPLHLRIGR